MIFPLVTAFACLGSVIWMAVGLLGYFAVFLTLKRLPWLDIAAPSDGNGRAMKWSLKGRGRPVAIALWATIVFAFFTLTEGGLAPMLGLLAALISRRYTRQA